MKLRPLHSSSVAAAALCACLAVGLGACNQDAPSNPPRTTSGAVPAPDNTKINERDRPSDLHTAANGPTPPTPLDQGNGAADLAVTQRIRQSIVGNPSLSVDAKNVKIITANGVVTLRGPVESDVERATIASKATELASGYRVDDLIDVKRAQ